MTLGQAARRRLQRLHDRRGREKLGLLLLEGERVVALAQARGLQLEGLVVLESREDLRERFPAAAPVTLEELRQVSTTTTPAPVVAAAPIPRAPALEQLEATAGLLALDGVQDPGNVGALVRTADAYGLGGVLLGPGSVDPWSPKVLRGSMGAALAIPILTRLPLAAALHTLVARGVQVLAGATRGGRAPEGPATGPWCLVLGSEARGLSPEVEELPLHRLTLPIGGSVGNLGVASAGAILVHLLAQRGNWR
jgi:TrmH family RNA methyltransferase